MAEERVGTRSYGVIFITGLVSLVVGVLGGVLVNRITERRPGLEYDVVTPALFTGERESIGVLVLNVSNPAKREVENVTCTLRLGSLELREAKIVGLQRGAYSQIMNSGVFQLDVPYLNPEEPFSVQLLVASNKPEIEVPRPSVRARGIVGVDRATRQRRAPLTSILSFLAAAFSALIPVSMLRYLRRHPPRILFTKRHRGDERDILAFVFEIHGFHEEAHLARTSGRRLSYWAEADRLTEAILRDAEPDKIGRAIACLERLIDYAAIDEPSEWLIHFDIARLAVRIGDEASVTKHLVAARRHKHQVIEKRLVMDEKLAAFANRDGTV